MLASIPHATELTYPLLAAALYCALLLALIVTDAVGTNAFYIFLDAVRHSRLSAHRTPLTRFRLTAPSHQRMHHLLRYLALH